MPEGNQSRRDDAPRVADVRLVVPRLSETTVAGQSPFHDDDAPLDQAGAVLALIQMAFNSSGRPPERGLIVDALNAASSLIAVSRHLGDVRHADMLNRAGAEGL